MAIGRSMVGAATIPTVSITLEAVATFLPVRLGAIDLILRWRKGKT